MENRFLEVDQRLRKPNGTRPGMALGQSWAMPFAASDRTLVVLIENGGTDLWIPELVDLLLSHVPGLNAIPSSYKTSLVTYIRDTVKGWTDPVIETLELTLNRYTAAKPDPYGDVIVLRDGTASYQELKRTLISLSEREKIVDLLILTHGRENTISLKGAIDDAMIRAMKTEYGRPLRIRAVYMMNCKGSSLNQAWIDVGAKVAQGSIRNNYLPEPTTCFFWNAWKDGQTFENAVTGAYRRTINLMNDALRGFVTGLPIPGSGKLAALIDVEALDFVKDSAPVIVGQRSVTITSDALTFTLSNTSSMATTVLPMSVLQALSEGQAAPAPGGPGRSVSAQGIDFIKGWEGFRATMYNDPVGHCTIGYGTLLHAGNCDGRPAEHAFAEGVTEAKATDLLRQHAAEFQQVVNETVAVPLNQNQNDALVSFAYNVGGANFRKSTLLRLLNEGDYEAVPTELRKWTKARKDGQMVDLPGLVKRRAAEAELFARAPATSNGSAAQSLSVSGQAFGAVHYAIPGTFKVVAQTTGRTCWAAVVTMMASWRHQKSLDTRTVLAKAGQPYVDRYEWDQSLDAEGAKLLYDALGLVTITSFNPTIEAWESLLRKYGPLYVDVGSGSSTMTHAVVVTAISGDGTAGGTSITVADPDGGTTTERKFSEFLAEYESPTAVNNWPHVIVHWPAQPSAQQSLPATHSHSYHSPSAAVQMSGLSQMQAAPLVIAGITVADAAQVGLAGVAIVQAQFAASQGSFSLTYDKAQRLLTSQARAAMPGAQATKQPYSELLFHLGIGRLGTATADIVIEWEGNPYGEIGTPVIRRKLEDSTEWSSSLANITISRIERIPVAGTDPRAWPINFTYEGTFDPLGNGYFEFSGEFEVNAFGGLKFVRHDVVSRSTADWAIAGTPEGKVQRGSDRIMTVPAIPQEQIEYLKKNLP